MQEAQSLVRRFHTEVANVPASPAEPMLRNPMLRASLIIEEAIETVFALIGSVNGQNLVHSELASAIQKASRGDGKPNLIEAIDGICDEIVVCLGTAEDIGIEIMPFFEEVMRANLAKANGPVRADGKKLKPPGWTPPDIGRVLAEQRIIIQQVLHTRSEQSLK